MRAIVFESCGEPAHVLACRDVPQPELSHGQLLIRMLSSPINPSDLLFIRGAYGQRPALPAIPGFEGVGIVERSGGGLPGRLLAGRRVCVPNPNAGNWAEFTRVDARQVFPVPGAVSDQQAATFVVNPMTAYAMTRKVLRVPSGGWLLQTAAASNLGRMVIRLGRHYGFRTINIIRRHEQVEQLKRLGADEVCVFDGSPSQADELVDRVRSISGGIRSAIDAVGGPMTSAVVRCLGKRGKLLVYGVLADQPLQLSPRALIMQEATVSGFWLGPWMQRQSLPGKLSLIRRIGRLIRAGVLDSDIGETFSLDDVAAAVTAAEKPGRTGKALFQCAER